MGTLNALKLVVSKVLGLIQVLWLAGALIFVLFLLFYGIAHADGSDIKPVIPVEVISEIDTPPALTADDLKILEEFVPLDINIPPAADNQDSKS